MDLRKLTLRMEEKKRQNVIITFEKGQAVRRTHDIVCADVMIACEKLRQWGVTAGMRVGIWACNCYEWIIYDVALLELRALSVAFTDDFAGKSADELIEKYSLSLLLVPGSEKAHKNSRQAEAIAFMDAENDRIKAISRPRAQADWEFEHTGLIFSSGSSGKLKGLKLDRKSVV